MPASNMPADKSLATPLYYSSRRSLSPPFTLPPMSALLDHEPPRADLGLYHSSPSLSQVDSGPSMQYMSLSGVQNGLFDDKESPWTRDRISDLTMPQVYPLLSQRRQNKRILQRRVEYTKDRRDIDEEIALGVPGNGFRQLKTEARPCDHLDHSSVDLVASGTPKARNTQSVPISGLLSGTMSYVIYQSSIIHANPHRSNFSRAEPTYRIHMRQEPIAARACGFGERDRRVIDPPPILQMTITAPHASPEEVKGLLRQNYAVVHCILWDPLNNRDDTTMPCTAEKRQQRRLMGTLVASPFFGKDEYGVEGCFFTFPDLSVRTPGTYSLKFSLVILSLDSMAPGASAPVRHSVWSCPFQVFNAKDFGGMRPSTELTKRLKCQGCLISVKKGNIKTSLRGHGGNEGDKEQSTAAAKQRSGGGEVKSEKSKRVSHLSPAIHDS